MPTSTRKSRRKKAAPYRNNVGSLKLEEPYDTQFKQVLRDFGFESVPSFIRQCAFSLLRQRDVKLVLPLEFKTFPAEN